MQLQFISMESNITIATSLARKNNQKLLHRFANKLEIDGELKRVFVSFQSNKKAPFYRWFKYKEGFSKDLVEYFCNKFLPRRNHPPRILDPFAGAGTTLTAARELGWDTTGIELLPVGLA